MKLPAEWCTYLLDPLVADVSEMERLVLLGNRVYINEEKLPADKCIEAYKTRDEYLVQALRYLDDFDAKFERLMSCVNVAGSEMRHLKSAMHRILDDIRREHPDMEKVKIQMVAHRDSMEYVAENGSGSGSPGTRTPLRSFRADFWGYRLYKHWPAIGGYARRTVIIVIMYTT